MSSPSPAEPPQESVGSLSRLRAHAGALSTGPIVRNAASLYGSTIVTSVLGFGFWILAAHVASPAAVGSASAIQSASIFFATFCVFGMNTLVLSEVAHNDRVARSLIATAIVLVGALSLLIALAGAIVLRTTSGGLRTALATPGEIILFSTLVSLTTILLITDDAFIGLLKGGLQLRRNTIFAAARLAALPIFMSLVASSSGAGIVLAWLVGLVASFVATLIYLHKLTHGQAWRPRLDLLHSNRWKIVSHHWLNLSVNAVRLLLPVMVAITLGTKDAASFTAAALMVGAVNIIPGHLSTVLFALKPGDDAALRIEVSRTMRISLYVALVAGPFFLVASPYLLRLFGAHYVQAAPAMAILGFTTLPAATKAHYAAIARVRGQMAKASILTTLGACVEIAFAVTGAAMGGLTGFAAGYLIAYVIEALLFAPTVLGALRSTPAHAKKS